jgi:predicted XRE-type DNA-binding protein
MSTIKNIDKLQDLLSSEELKQMDVAAAVHKSQSNITFSILKVDNNITHIETVQSETRSGKYANEATLLKKTHEVFDKWLLNQLLQIDVSTHMPSPTSIVTTEWVERKMKEKGVAIKQIAFDTGVDRSSISNWISGKKSMSQLIKAMFYFYFSK